MSANKIMDEQEAASDLVLYAKEIEYFDTHDMSEELEKMPEVHFEISPNARRKRYPLNAELSSKLDDIARQRGVSPETLLNAWVQEKTAEVLAVGAAE